MAKKGILSLVKVLCVREGISLKGVEMEIDREGRKVKIYLATKIVARVNPIELVFCAAFSLLSWWTKRFALGQTALALVVALALVPAPTNNSHIQCTHTHFVQYESWLKISMAKCTLLATANLHYSWVYSSKCRCSSN